jgi:ribonuclease D
MAGYAASDTRYLADLAEKLGARLEELGRTSWAEEEFVRLEAVRWSGEADPATAFLRIKGVKRLDRRGLAIARELFTLRDRLARERDLPPYRILRDEVIVLLTELRPRSAAAFEPIRELPRPWKRPSRSRLLREAIGRALALDEADLPERPRQTLRRRTPSFDTRLKRLSRERDRVSADLGIEPSIVAPRAVLERGLERIDAGGEPTDLPEMRRWQAGLLTPLFADLG